MVDGNSISLVFCHIGAPPTTTASVETTAETTTTTINAYEDPTTAFPSR